MKAVVLLTATLAATSASAQAEDQATQGTRILELDGVTLARTEERFRVQEEYDAIRLGPPAVGIVISTLGIVVGPVLMVVGSLDNFCLCDDPGPLSAGGRAMIGTGTIMTFGGFAGLIASSVVLAKKKRHRTRLAAQLRTEEPELRKARAMGNSTSSPSPGALGPGYPP